MGEVETNAQITMGMPEEQAATRNVVLNSLLSSGFPFQTAITEIVKTLSNHTIAAIEFPWRDELGTDRFLDLIVRRPDLTITIECKKTKNEKLTFLQPRLSGTANEDENRYRCVYLHDDRVYEQDTRQHVTKYVIACADWMMKPRSPEAMFCVVGTSDSGRDSRMLEKDAQLLIRGTDAYTLHERSKVIRNTAGPQLIVVPVIVTNADLFTATYDPNDVSLDSGELREIALADVSPVQCIRFRKAFTAGSRDAGDRSVFVVAANSLQTFLHDLDVISRTPKNSVTVEI